MSFYGAASEYGIHCLLHLANVPEGVWPSARDVADFQGVSSAYVAKLFTQLQKAGIVQSSGGKSGGFRLARAAENISVLDVVDAVEGKSPLFRCREIRKNCVLFQNKDPDWTQRGVCAIHATMRAAEVRMRDVLAQKTLASLTRAVAVKQTASEGTATREWFDHRQITRRQPDRPLKAMRGRRVVLANKNH
ncbi:MAG TPA: Rrf2 family transcriptional regulator [Steroidobacteraceae bacterium]